MGNRGVSRSAPIRLQRQGAPGGAPTPAPAGTSPKPATPAYTITADDKLEFTLLPGNIKKASGKDIASVSDYVTFRHTFFGSAAKYTAAKALADAEFAAMPKRVWNRIGQRGESKAAKEVLYRWLRQAYLNEGISTPVATIGAGMTPALRAKVAAVVKAHPSLRIGGFVARPKKLKGYRLGTLSEHGTGKAFDVKPQNKNPHLKKSEWTFIKKMTGTTVVNTRARWKKDPGGLWQDFHDLNVTYVAELKKEIAKVEAARRAAGKPPSKPPAIRSVLKRKPSLLECADVYGVNQGFFDLDKLLVTDLAAQGLRWGATFGTHPDLHHFEIP